MPWEERSISAPPYMEEDMRRKKLIAVTCLVISVLLISCPFFQRLQSDKARSEVLYVQAESVSSTDKIVVVKELEAADKYNASLANGLAAITNEERAAAGVDYLALLNLAGDGIMGTLEIPILDTTLPIAHGTDTKTLEHYVGHVVGSSLPVGGPNTHAVLSGHSGMAGSKMFSDLEQLQVGDYFVIHVLGLDLYYLIDQINIVLPDDTSKLGIERGKDYVTLVTCTPYGVNTHRLLVRGVRISEEEVPPLPVEQRNEWTTKSWQGVLVVTGSTVIALVVLAVVRRKKK